MPSPAAAAEVGGGSSSAGAGPSCSARKTVQEEVERYSIAL